MKYYKKLNEQCQYDQQKHTQRLGSLWQKPKQTRIVDFSIYGVDINLLLNDFQKRQYYDYSSDGKYFSIIQNQVEPIVLIYIFDILNAQLLKIELQETIWRISFTLDSNYLLAEFEDKFIIYTILNLNKTLTIKKEKYQNYELISNYDNFLYIFFRNTSQAFLKIFNLQNGELIKQLEYLNVHQLQCCQLFNISQNVFFIGFCYEDKFWRYFEENNFEIKCTLANLQGKTLSITKPYVRVENIFGISITQNKESHFCMYNLCNAFSNKLIRKVEINQQAHIQTSFLDTHIIITYNDIIIQSWIYCYSYQRIKQIIVTEIHFIKRIKYGFYRYAGQKQINQNRAFVVTENGAVEFNIF